jgi:hypothetical protein
MKIKDLVFNEFNEAKGYKGVFKICYGRENGIDWYWFEVNGGNEEGEMNSKELTIQKANERNKKDIKNALKEIEQWEVK